MEVRTLFCNNLIIKDQMMSADDEAPFRGAPSVGSLSALAALPGQAEGSPSPAAPCQPGSGSLTGVSRGTAWGDSGATGSTLVQQQPQPGLENTKGTVVELFEMLELLSSPCGRKQIPSLLLSFKV